MEIISCKQLTFTYNGSSRKTLENVDFDVQSGDIVLLAGLTGSGKSTLLRLLKKEIAPAGTLTGSITVCGRDQSEITQRESAELIAYVSQDPDTQAVTHKVSTELAFGLENLGEKPSRILSRVGEMATYFGIENIYDKLIDELSGGEKQLCSLCAAAVMSSKLLILDEPAAQLDPIGSHKLFSALRRLNSELGTTIIIAEHEPREIFEVCTKVIFLENGTSRCFENKEDFCRVAADDAAMKGYLPTSVRATLPLGKPAFTVRDAKSALQAAFGPQPQPEQQAAEHSSAQTALEAKNVYFRYERSGKDVLSQLDLSLRKGEIFAAVGSNGSGKTTMLKVLSGILRPWQGKLRLFSKPFKSYKGNTLYRGNIALMPQDPYDLFTQQTVEKCFEHVCSDMGSKGGYSELCERFSLSHLLGMHPYDLSGGEIQKCAVVKLLLTQPQVMFMDEPSKGLDPGAKQMLGELLRELAAQGKTICLATHDIEFAAKFADRCGLFFNGKIQSLCDTSDFFIHNRFYTTDACRIARELFPCAVTAEQLEDSVDNALGR